MTDQFWEIERGADGVPTSAVMLDPADVTVYEGYERQATGVDRDDHLTGEGLTWLAGGECAVEDSLSVEFALDRIRENA